MTAASLPASVEVSVETLSAEIVHLRAALESRDIIGQAKGILMHIHKITANDAFDLLVTWSQREGIKVHDLAERVVATEI